MLLIRIALLTFYFCMTDEKLCKKHIKNSLFPNYAAIPTYDVREWVINLYLQRCTIIEIGEEYAAIFLEEDHSSVNDSINFFLGICDYTTLRTWSLCSPDLERQRPRECMINMFASHYRVHRRFCDINHIILTQPNCNCSIMFDKPLLKVTGFPTCFNQPLPESLCGAYNVCGIHNCSANTILNRIHSVKCDPNCKGRQPFCEYPIGEKTAMIPAVISLWSDWYEIEKTNDPENDTQLLYYEAKCVNKYTGLGGIDCLGPGTSCCPPDILNCQCKTYLEDGNLRVKRTMIVEIEHTTVKSKDYDVIDDVVEGRTLGVPRSFTKRIDVNKVERNENKQTDYNIDILSNQDRVRRENFDDFDDMRDHQDVDYIEHVNFDNLDQADSTPILEYKEQKFLKDSAEELVKAEELTNDLCPTDLLEKKYHKKQHLHKSAKIKGFNDYEMDSDGVYDPENIRKESNKNVLQSTTYDENYLKSQNNIKAFLRSDNPKNAKSLSKSNSTLNKRKKNTSGKTTHKIPIYYQDDDDEDDLIDEDIAIEEEVFKPDEDRDSEMTEHSPTTFQELQYEGMKTEKESKRKFSSTAIKSLALRVYHLMIIAIFCRF